MCTTQRQVLVQNTWSLHARQTYLFLLMGRKSFAVYMHKFILGDLNVTICVCDISSFHQMLVTQVECSTTASCGISFDYQPCCVCASLNRIINTLFPFLSLLMHAMVGFLYCQHGADVDAVDASGHTPLFRACEQGQSEVVLTLLQYGASVQLLDADGRTCLHWAASAGHDFICTTLLHHSVPVNVVDNNR